MSTRSLPRRRRCGFSSAARPRRIFRATKTWRRRQSSVRAHAAAGRRVAEPAPTAISILDKRPANRSNNKKRRRGCAMEFVELNGVGLRYEMTGKGERTVVLVHEMGGSLESWDDVAPKLAGSRRVLRYDTRGAGLSQKVRGVLGIDTMADDIAALLDHLRISGKVALA